jgi:hypothetical protein
MTIKTQRGKEAMNNWVEDNTNGKKEKSSTKFLPKASVLIRDLF